MSSSLLAPSRKQQGTCTPFPAHTHRFWMLKQQSDFNPKIPDLLQPPVGSSPHPHVPQFPPFQAKTSIHPTRAASAQPCLHPARRRRVPESRRSSTFPRKTPKSLPGMEELPMHPSPRGAGGCHSMRNGAFFPAFNKLMHLEATHWLSALIF